jgi:Zn-dependent peptidase ImmA (M78 family)/transcriptional regulator with XRE-family HTH domain
MRKKGESGAVDVPSGFRLRAARKMAGLSMEELARRLDGIVTKQAIAKYEKGKMRPSPEVLERLSRVLAIPPEIPGEIALPAGTKEALLEGETAVMRELSASVSRAAAQKDALYLFSLDAVGGKEKAMKPGSSAAAPLARSPQQSKAGEHVAYSSRGPGLFRLFARSRKKEAGAAANEARAAVGETPSAAREAEYRLEEVTGARLLREEPPLLCDVAESPAVCDFVQSFENESAFERALDFSSVRFRERSAIPAKLESALRYTIADRMNRLMAVEAMLGSRVVFRNPLEGASPGTGAPLDAEKAAVAVRTAWKLSESPIPNLLGLLEDKGIGVCEVTGFEDFDGLSAAFGSRCVVVINPDLPADRVRFTAAHELAHLLGLAGAGPESAESVCHEFAAAFLLPREALARLMTPAGRKVALAELAELKRTYGISLQAIMRRAHGLGLVTDRQHRRFRETFRDRGWLEAEPVEYGGKEKAGRFRRLLDFAVAEDILDLERAAALAGVAPDEFKKAMGEVF